jgi:hypothetical protein
MQDTSFGQILLTTRIFGLPFTLPTSLVYFHLEWVGQDTWRRTSRILNIFDVNGWNYNLRRIVKTDGSKAYWFDRGWSTAKNGVGVAVGVPI